MRRALLVASSLVFLAGSARAEKRTVWTAPPTIAPAAPFEGEGATQLRIEADHPWGTYLFAEAPHGAGWDRICEAPCNQAVDPKRTYRIDGVAVRPSQPFTLEGGRPQALYVRSGNAGAYYAGWSLLVTGVMLAIPGAYIASRGVDVTDRQTGRTEHTRLPGYILLGVGAVMLAPGLALVVSNGTTEVTDDRGRRLASRVSLHGRF